jgi:hypothetical protein
VWVKCVTTVRTCDRVTVPVEADGPAAVCRWREGWAEDEWLAAPPPALCGTPQPL